MKSTAIPTLLIFLLISNLSLQYLSDIYYERISDRDSQIRVTGNTTELIYPGLTLTNLISAEQHCIANCPKASDINVQMVLPTQSAVFRQTVELRNVVIQMAEHIPESTYFLLTNDGVLHYVKLHSNNASNTTLVDSFQVTVTKPKDELGGKIWMDANNSNIILNQKYKWLIKFTKNQNSLVLVNYQPILSKVADKYAQKGDGDQSKHGPVNYEELTLAADALSFKPACTGAISAVKTFSKYLVVACKNKVLFYELADNTAPTEKSLVLTIDKFTETFENAAPEDKFAIRDIGINERENVIYILEQFAGIFLFDFTGLVTKDRYVNVTKIMHRIDPFEGEGIRIEVDPSNPRRVYLIDQAFNARELFIFLENGLHTYHYEVSSIKLTSDADFEKNNQAKGIIAAQVVNEVFYVATNDIVQGILKVTDTQERNVLRWKLTNSVADVRNLIFSKNSIVALRNNQKSIDLYQIVDEPATLKLTRLNKEQFKILPNFELEFTTTKCKSKIKSQDFSPLSYCIMYHNVTLDFNFISPPAPAPATKPTPVETHKTDTHTSTTTQQKQPTSTGTHQQQQQHTQTRPTPTHKIIPEEKHTSNVNDKVKEYVSHNVAGSEKDFVVYFCGVCFLLFALFLLVKFCKKLTADGPGSANGKKAAKGRNSYPKDEDDL